MVSTWRVKATTHPSMKPSGALNKLSWGGHVMRWGNGCADKLALTEYLDKCKSGDVQACTYVNQKLHKED